MIAAVGAALVVGKVGGRRLPAAAADLLRYGFGARRFRGHAAQLVRPEPPRAAVRAQRGKPSARALTRQAAKGSGALKRGARKLANLKPSPRPRTRGERMPLRPREWFRKRDRKRQSKQEYDEAREALTRPRAELEAREQREHRFTPLRLVRGQVPASSAGRRAGRANGRGCRLRARRLGGRLLPAPSRGRRGRRGALDLGRDRVRSATADHRSAALRRAANRDPRCGHRGAQGCRGPRSRGPRLRRCGWPRSPVPALRANRAETGARAICSRWTDRYPRSPSPGATSTARPARSRSQATSCPIRCRLRRANSASCG